MELIEEALALARKLGDKATAASALLNLGWAALLRDELRMAGVLTQESLTLQREMNNQGGVARALTVLGLLASARGDHKRAMALHEEGLGLSREAREAGGIVVSLMQGAIASLGRGDHRRAGELCEEGLESSWRLKMVHPTASHFARVRTGLRSCHPIAWSRASPSKPRRARPSVAPPWPRATS